VTTKTLTGSNSNYVMSGSGITLTNLGTLTGKAAITVEGTTDTVVNAGTIAGSMSTGYGVQLRAPALVVNQAGGTISGTRGIRAEDGAATVANAAPSSAAPTPWRSTRATRTFWRSTLARRFPAPWTAETCWAATLSARWNWRPPAAPAR
jgi:hypothetical protein